MKFLRPNLICFLEIKVKIGKHIMMHNFHFLIKYNLQISPQKHFFLPETELN